jgi:tRNA pseudouridine55 synthase
MQKPPIYSAIKIDGERLYKKARRGETTEIKLRPITIHRFEILKREGNDFHFVLDCSKGTYVRSLAFDFGKALKSGGYLKSLRRDKIGDFKLENSWDFEILKAQLDNWREIEKTDVS